MGDRSTAIRSGSAPLTASAWPAGHASDFLEQGFAIEAESGAAIATPGAGSSWDVVWRPLLLADTVELLGAPGQLPVLLTDDRLRPGRLLLERTDRSLRRLAGAEWAGDAFGPVAMDATGSVYVSWHDSTGLRARWYSATNAWLGEAFTPPLGTNLERLIGGGLLLDRTWVLRPDGSVATAPSWMSAAGGSLSVLRGRWYAIADPTGPRITVRDEHGNWCGEIALERSSPSRGRLTVTADGTLEGPTTQCTALEMDWLRVVWLWPHALRTEAEGTSR